MLNWANQFNIFCFLDNNNFEFEQPVFDCLLAVGSKRSIELQTGHAFQTLKDFYEQQPSWLFGHLGYGLKNETEALSSATTAEIDFGAGFFFEPETLISITNGKLSITGSPTEADLIFKAIEQQPAEIQPAFITPPTIDITTKKADYLNIIHALQQHILRGDCYEINFCQHFSATHCSIDPIYTFQQLTSVSPTPFAALYKKEENYCLCASPERYLKKSGQTIISQPMKGTSKRNFTDAATDKKNKEHLINSTKERSENVMVVDLVRNDLSKICQEGSVVVEELFGVYSFAQVHQMTSTVKGLLSKGLHWTDAIKATFPMGSMTGAPKKRVMELIEQYESVDRGLFSGSIGYVTPAGDFDFNVVIRSIFYDDKAMRLSFFAGSGITFYSNAEEEYEECIVKTAAVYKALGH